MEQYRARRTSSMNSFFSLTVRVFNGPCSSFDACTRSSFSAERHRANTLSPISVSGIPRSSAEIAVHFPVPFCPAVSRILSTIGAPSSSFFAKIVAEISIR